MHDLFAARRGVKVVESSQELCLFGEDADVGEVDVGFSMVIAVEHFVDGFDPIEGEGVFILPAKSCLD